VVRVLLPDVALPVRRLLGVIVAVWHTAYNITTATEATTGVLAAISSSVVIVAGLLLLLRSAPTARGPGPS
jgi:hypothetical protein